MHGASEEAWLAAAKDLERNVLLAVQGHDYPLLLHRRLEASQLSWIAGDPPDQPPCPFQARIRHRHPLQDCRMMALHEDRCEIEFDCPQRAIAPGQSVVFYPDSECPGA